MSGWIAPAGATFALQIACALISTQRNLRLASLGLQFVDMLAGAAQLHFEDGNSDSWKPLASQVVLTKLFF
ncbi:MAG: hypothetical protein WC091_04825 [Sulfuricellaceae bacterium]